MNVSRPDMTWTSKELCCPGNIYKYDFFFNIDRLLLQTEYKLLVQLGFTLILRGILEYTFKSNSEYTLTLFIDIIYEYE